MTQPMGGGVNQRGLIKMTPDEVEAFLAERRSMTMSTISGDGSIDASSGAIPTSMPASRTAFTAWMWSKWPWGVRTRRTPVALQTSSSSSCSLAASTRTASPLAFDRRMNTLFSYGPTTILSIRTSAANPNSGSGYELEVIAMVVIGGTALSGGRGTIIGTVLGIFILRVMRNGIVMIGVPGLAYNIFIGAIILGMMALHSWLERRHQTGT